MTGRITGDQERAIILAHQIEVMARQQKLKPVRHYLTPANKSPESGAARVNAMLNRLARKDRSNGE
jgi:hypothetical protein